VSAREITFIKKVIKAFLYPACIGEVSLLCSPLQETHMKIFMLESQQDTLRAWRII